ncbi:MAG TPA: proline dehydrogenase family protein [Terrimesophilobacter sp.]|uniref:proline dehydrogenase family protein n=1 Tax=Terrimesophilobacter sp. TaxID=2906435 RepID=UPI002F9267B0
MSLRDPALPVHALAEETIATVHRWLAAATGDSVPPGEARLGRLLSDPDGPEFALGFVDGVLRPSDLKVAARNLERLSRRMPASIRWHAEVGTQLAGGFAPILPAPIVPVARDGFLRTVGHLLLQLGGHAVERQFADLLAGGGIRPMIAPIGAMASGHREADRQLADARELLSRPDVDAISISLAEVVGRQNPLDLDAEVREAVNRLAPLYELAATSSGDKFINLDIRRFHELELTVQVFRGLCELYPGLEAGVTLPAYLPDSLAALQQIEEWAGKRHSEGGARVFVRLVKGDQLGEEREEAMLHGWPSAAFATRTETDAQYKRMLDYALTPERCAAVHVIVATHNLFDAAFAWRLARLRGVERGVEHEFMLGIASDQVSAVKRDVGGIRLYTPVVQHGQLALAVPYLIRRLHDLTDTDDFLSIARVATDENLLRREEERFLASLEHAYETPPTTYRRQDPVRAEETDFTIPANRDWAKAVLLRAADSAAGEDLLARSRLQSAEQLDQLVVAMARAGEEWGQRRGSTRSKVLASAAEAIAEWRGLLVEAAVSESGLTILEADREVAAAINLAGRAAEGAKELDGVESAKFVPSRLVVVASPRSGPIASPAGAILAALAAGSAVILKTSPETRRSAAVLIELLRAGGVPPELLGLLDDEGELAARLVSHPSVDRVVLSGSRHTAKLFHSWRAELNLLASTGGRNCVIVTPSADLETAVHDVVAGAFDHAGQAPGATSIVILVGSVAEDSRFRGRLTDAVASLQTGDPRAAATRLSALARPASGRVLASLETLEDGENWLVRPKPLDESGRLWSPGLRDGVGPDSAFHRREGRAPVLGIMQADTLAEAISLQNGRGFGLTAGIQSLDAAELREWFESVEAGMLFANRPVVPAPRSRLPFGGWGRSQIGAGWKAGGPNELVALGGWEPVFADPESSVTLDGISTPVAALIEAAQPSMSFLEFDRVRAGARSDERAWRGEFAAARDVAGLGVERNLFRYRPVPVTIRLAEGAAPSQLVRVLTAAARSGAVVAISSAVPIHADLITIFGDLNPPVGVAEVLVESDVRWHARVQAGGVATTRIRLIGGDARVLARVLHGRPGIAVHAGPVTTSGRLELLPFLREQSITVRALRHGFPDPRIAALPL